MLRHSVVAILFLGVAPLMAQDTGIVGAWRLNPELSTSVPAPPDGREARPEGRGQSGRPPGGRGGGGGGRGMGGGRMGGRGGAGMPGMGRGGPSQDDMRRLQVIRRRLFEAPAQIVLVRDANRFSITDGEGRSFTYKADGKKEERVTGDGEFTSRARLEGEALAVEEDFGGGVKLVTRYAPIVSENRQRLEVSLKAAGLPTPPNMPNRDRTRPEPLDAATRVYERVER